MVELETQKTRVQKLWKLNCDQLAEMDSSLLLKEEEIDSLIAEVARLRGISPVSRMPLEEMDLGLEKYRMTHRDKLHQAHQGKTSPS